MLAGIILLFFFPAPVQQVTTICVRSETIMPPVSPLSGGLATCAITAEKPLVSPWKVPGREMYRPAPDRQKEKEF